MINKVQGVLEKNDMIFCIARLNQYFFNVHTCAKIMIWMQVADQYGKSFFSLIYIMVIYYGGSIIMVDTWLWSWLNQGHLKPQPPPLKNRMKCQCFHTNKKFVVGTSFRTFTFRIVIHPAKQFNPLHWFAPAYLGTSRFVQNCHKFHAQLLITLSG